MDNDPSLSGGSRLYSDFNHHPVGLMYLAAYLRRTFPDISIKIFHTAVSSDPLGEIITLLAYFAPDLIGLRSLSISRDYFMEISAAIHKNAPSVPIVAGGPYPSVSYHDIVSSGAADIAVIGEGEETFAELVGRLVQYPDMPLDIPGTAVVYEGEVRLNPARPFIDDLDNLPFPAYDLIDLNKYRGKFDLTFQDSAKSAVICASRGCPYSCFYCHQLFGKRIRRRSSENIVAEMKWHLEERGMESFIFVDDIFNCPLDKAKETLELIIRKLPGVRLNFPNGFRADMIDDELLELLSRAGTVHIAIAIESASPRIQKLIGKNLDIERAREYLKRATTRFIVRGYFMVGFPGETYEEGMETVRFAEEQDCLAEPVLSVPRVYNNSGLIKMLNPSEAQLHALSEQEKQTMYPTYLSEMSYYGDLFSKDEVPLSGHDIKALQWEWISRVTNNKKRIINSHEIVQRFLTSAEALEYYRNVYDNSDFDEKSLHKLLRSAQTKQ